MNARADAQVSPTVAERVRVALGPEIERLADTVRSALADSRVETWVRGGENAPYHATVGVSEHDPNGDEVIVLTIELGRSGSEGLLATSDLSRGNGAVLLEGPTVHSEPARAADVDAWLAATAAFLRLATVEAIREARQRGLG